MQYSIVNQYYTTFNRGPAPDYVWAAYSQLEAMKSKQPIDNNY